MKKPEKCSYCGNENAKKIQLRNNPTTNGYLQIGWRCLSCGRLCKKEHKWESHEDVREFLSRFGKNLEDIPPFSDEDKRQECVHCHKIAFGENHHFAPKKFFGEEDAETWPIAFLCNECHHEWHRKVGGYIKKP